MQALGHIIQIAALVIAGLVLLNAIVFLTLIWRDRNRSIGAAEEFVPTPRPETTAADSEPLMLEGVSGDHLANTLPPATLDFARAQLARAAEAAAKREDICAYDQILAQLREFEKALRH